MEGVVVLQRMRMQRVGGELAALCCESGSVRSVAGLICEPKGGTAVRQIGYLELPRGGKNRRKFLFLSFFFFTLLFVNHWCSTCDPPLMLLSVQWTLCSDATLFIS